MVHYKTKEDQEKIKRKARRYALLLLLLLLLILFLPFFSSKLQTQQKYNEVITVKFEEDFQQFKDTKSSAAKSSARPSAKTEELKVEEQEPTVTEPEPEVKPEPEPKPKRNPAPKVEAISRAESKPLLTTPEPNLSLPAVIGKISENAKVQTVSQEVTEVTEELSDDFAEEIASFFKKAKKSSSSSGKSKTPSSGKKSDAGEGDAGSSDEGDAKSDGKGESGDSGDDFDGDGLLTRKVIHRANLNNLIKETGKIVINLCVNRDGKVIFSQADKKNSTIADPVLLKKAESTASKYRYEKDYTVAEKQCGKLSFVVTIKK